MLTKEQIENSLEAGWRKTFIKVDLIILSIVFVVCAAIILVFALLGAFVTMKDLLLCAGFFGILYAVLLAACLSDILFHRYQYKKLFQNLELYTVYEVLPDQPKRSRYYRRSTYYTVSIPLSLEKTVKVDTKPIWSDAIYTPRFSDYHNKTIKVAYSESLDKLIVIEQRKETPV